MKTRIFIVFLITVLAACAPTPTPTPAPTVTPGSRPTTAPTPDNLDLESIIVKNDDSRLQGVEWREVTVEYIAFNPPDGTSIRMHWLRNDDRHSAIWTLYANEAEMQFISNYGVEYVPGTETDIKVGRGSGWYFSTVQLPFADDEVVVEHLIGRSWAMAFRRYELNKWEAALVSPWP